MTEFCVSTAAIRSALQQQRIQEPAKEILKRILHSRLAEIGLSVPDEAIAAAAAFTESLPEIERVTVSGLSFVREHAAMWMFDTRSSFFAPES